MAAASYSSDVRRIDKAIQRLPPELREIIYKEYVAIKKRERAALGWNKVNEEILKKPFCCFMQQIVPTKISMDVYVSSFNCYCNSCLVSVEKKGQCLHKVLVSAEMEILSQDMEIQSQLEMMDMKGKIEMIMQMEMEIEKYEMEKKRNMISQMEMEMEMDKIPLIEKKRQDYLTILREFYK